MYETVIFLLMLAIIILAIFCIFVVKESNNFLVAIRNTRTYKMILIFTLQTIIVLSVIGIFSYFLLLKEVVSFLSENFELITLSGGAFILWCSLLLSLVPMSLFKCAHFFVIIVTAKIKEQPHE